MVIILRITECPQFRYCSNFPTATSKYNKIVTDSQSKSTKAAFFRRCSSRSPDSDPVDPFKTRRRLRRGIGSISSINVLWDDSDDAGEYRRLKEEPHFATVSRIVTNFAYIKIPQDLSFLSLFLLRVLFNPYIHNSIYIEFGKNNLSVNVIIKLILSFILRSLLEILESTLKQGSA